MRTRVGLFVQNGRLTLTAVTARRRVEHFTLESSENLPTLLKAELETRGLNMRGVRMGLARSLVTVKVIELPRADAADLAQMLVFELRQCTHSRHCGENSVTTRSPTASDLTPEPRASTTPAPS